MTHRFLIAALVGLLVAPAAAHEYKFGPLQIVHPWTRATPKGATVAGGYLKITNTGIAPDRLLGGTSSVAGRFEIHEMRMAGGVMQMRALPRGLELKPGETVELKPGSFHLMFMDLKRQLEQGERVKGTLVFEKAGTIEVEYVVEAVGGPPAAGHHGH